MTPRVPGMSYLFIKSIQSKSKLRDGGWYVLKILQFMTMDKVLIQNPCQVYT